MSFLGGASRAGGLSRALGRRAPAPAGTGRRRGSAARVPIRPAAVRSRPRRDASPTCGGRHEAVVPRAPPRPPRSEFREEPHRLDPRGDPMPGPERLPFLPRRIRHSEHLGRAFFGTVLHAGSVGKAFWSCNKQGCSPLWAGPVGSRHPRPGRGSHVPTSTRPRRPAGRAPMAVIREARDHGIVARPVDGPPHGLGGGRDAPPPAVRGRFRGTPAVPQPCRETARQRRDRPVETSRTGSRSFQEDRSRKCDMMAAVTWSCPGRPAGPNPGADPEASLDPRPVDSSSPALTRRKHVRVV